MGPPRFFDNTLLLHCPFLRPPRSMEGLWAKEKKERVDLHSQQVLEYMLTYPGNCLSFIMKPTPPTRLRNIFTYFNSTAGWSLRESHSKTTREEKYSWRERKKKKEFPISSVKHCKVIRILFMRFACDSLPSPTTSVPKLRGDWKVNRFWLKRCRQHSLSFCFSSVTELQYSTCLWLYNPTF